MHFAFRAFFRPINRSLDKQTFQKRKDRKNRGRGVVKAGQTFYRGFHHFLEFERPYFFVPVSILCTCPIDDFGFSSKVAWPVRLFSRSLAEKRARGHAREQSLWSPVKSRLVDQSSSYITPAKAKFSVSRTKGVIDVENRNRSKLLPVTVCFFHCFLPPSAFSLFFFFCVPLLFHIRFADLALPMKVRSPRIPHEFFLRDIVECLLEVKVHLIWWNFCLPQIDRLCSATTEAREFGNFLTLYLCFTFTMRILSLVILRLKKKHDLSRR